MSTFLLELRSEEIPARMQADAIETLRRMVADGLLDAGLDYDSVSTYVTPRRLTLIFFGIPEKSPDCHEERKGPRVGSPDHVIAGFVRSAGLSDIAEAEIVAGGKKGDFYVLRRIRDGQESPAILSGLIPKVIRGFPWPSSMCWGDGGLRWVRPLRSIVCLFGCPDKGMEVVRFSIGGIESGNVTRGHRFMENNRTIRIDSIRDYTDGLAAAHVMLDPAQRREHILSEARRLASDRGLVLVEDEALLSEVVGLVEWPEVLDGGFDAAFLDIPPEVIRTSIRTHQKCFVLRDAGSGALVNRFVLVANIRAEDGGQAIVAGNERVISARLADARFFYEQDAKVKLEERVRQLAGVVFHEKLGSQYDRVQRIVRRSAVIADCLGVDRRLAMRAAYLCKADLLTEMVGEFPELQGKMGHHYALKEGEPESVSKAIEEHYSPQGPSDGTPVDPVSIVVALADKLEMLVSFWGIGEIPTGSKDPYALRRATLGVIRIVLERELRLPLLQEIDGDRRLFAFFLERLRVYLRDAGWSADRVEAVISVERGQDDLLMVQRRLEALEVFLANDRGRIFSEQLKRVHNILRIEERADGRIRTGEFDDEGFVCDEEKHLGSVLDSIESELDSRIESFDFLACLELLTTLSSPIESFFETVVVNADESDLRENRLQLLARIERVGSCIVDFSRIGG